MNDQSVTAHEQEDAAFRARLAPLASEVLPSPPRAEPRSPGPRRSDMFRRARLAPSASDVLPPPSRPEPRPFGPRRPAVAAAVIAAAIVVLGIAWPQFKWPWSEAPKPAHTEALTNPATTAPHRSETTTKPATGDSARSSGPTDAAPSSSPPARTASEVETSSEAMIGLLVRRGDAALTDGDIMGARLLFERAAALGSGAAATAAGKTYDVEFLSQAGARGIRADQAAATAWFRKAAALGDPEARSRLARIEPLSRP
jgi:hypothetical protein